VQSGYKIMEVLNVCNGIVCCKSVTFKFRELIGMKIKNEWDNIKAY